MPSRSAMPSLVLLVAFASVCSAHMSIWTTAMYGMYSDIDPFAPLGPNWNFDDWWFRGPATRAMPPAEGLMENLPAGGSIVLEIACNIAFSTLGVSPSDNVACPGNNGAYHSGDPAGIIDYSLLAGCALAIADVTDISLVTLDNLAVFSVQQECVWQRDTTFEIPAAMPPCTGDYCICAWMWEPQNGTANYYQTPFRCNVTGSPIDATPIQTQLSDPVFCPDSIADCTAGAKRPIYAYNLDYTNIDYVSNYFRPGYHQSWSWTNGAQNDIFMSAAEAANYSSIEATATPTSTSAAAAATVYPLSTDLAMSAIVTVSSFSAGQPGTDATDGLLGGYVNFGTSNDTTDNEEWASNGQGAGAWLTLTWASPVTVGLVVLYDRPNESDNCESGTLTFSDGSVVDFGLLVNDGSATPVQVPTISTTSLTWTCTSVSAWTSNVGLSEIEVYASGGLAPATTTALVNGTATASGTASASSATATSFLSSTDLALSSTATASSFAAGSPPSAAIDGVLQGYLLVNGQDGGNSSAEWSSNGEGGGAWLTLTWAKPVSVSQVVLYDRPNLDDQCLAGSLTFSDGSVVNFGVEANDGSATPVAVPTISTTSITWQCDSVSATTENVGLMEIQVYGPSVSPSSSVISSAVSASSTNSSSIVSSSSKVSSSNVPASSSSTSSSHASSSSSVLSSTTASSSVASSSIVSSSSKASSSSVPASSSARSSSQVTSWSSSAPPPGPSSATSVAATPSSSSTTASSSSAVASPASSTQNLNSTDLALTATATASSFAAGSPPSTAIDGVLQGYLLVKGQDGGNSSAEWSSNGEGGGAWLTLTWPSAITVSSVVLYDRPNLSDQCLKGTLTFANGKIVKFGTLANNGAATPVAIVPSISTTTLSWQCDSVSASTENVGLMEIAVYGSAASPSSSVISSTVASSSLVSSSVVSSSSKVASSSVQASSSTVSSTPASSSKASSSSAVASSSSVTSSSAASSASSSSAPATRKRSEEKHSKRTAAPLMPSLISKAKREQTLARAAAARRAKLWTKKVHAAGEI